MAKERYTVKKILEAIPGTGGIVFIVAQKLGCRRETVSIKKSKSKVLQEAFEQERESMLDYAEAELFEKIRQGDNTMIIFFLKTQGKHRGYVERSETKDVSDPNRFAKQFAEMSKEDQQIWVKKVMSLLK